MGLLNIVFFLFALGFWASLIAWARWLAKRPRAPAPVRQGPWAVAVIAVLALAWVAYGIVGVAASFAAVGGESAESVDPSLKARHLGEGISQAMNCFAAGSLAAMVVAAALFAGTWRWHWRNLAGK